MKEEKKNKKKLLIVTGLSTLTILGGTLAYFTTNSDIDNVFKSGKYQNKIVEEFTSPTNWTPGTTTKKEVKVTNTGNVDMAVRATIKESWTSSSNKDLPLVDKDGNRIVTINYNDNWTLDKDGYYYYGSKSNLTKLLEDETTDSFIKSVTFNSNVEASLKEEISDDGKTITYTSSGEGYDDASYKLTVKIETIQYDHANDLWT